MSIILSDLFDATKNTYHLQLITGEDGLNTPIHWVQFTEDIGTTDFLKGGELIFTTGMSANSENWLYDFITQLIKQKTSGLVLNIGRYIFADSISNDVIDLCTKRHFPLFTMPWKVHLATIMQDYCNRIFMQSYQEDRTTMAFQQLLLHPNELESSIDTLNSLGYETNAPYLILICQNLESPTLLTKYLTNIGTQKYLFRIEERSVFVFQEASIELLSHELTNAKFTRLNPAVCFGIGDQSDSLLTLHHSYKHALFALKAAQSQGLTCLSFTELGPFKLFFAVSDKMILTELVESNLAVLEAYDLKNNANLIATLRLYIEHDGSIQAVADASFTHRNTINYRMKKIRQILKTELFTMEAKFNLRLAFLIKDFLSL